MVHKDVHSWNTSIPPDLKRGDLEMTLQYILDPIRVRSDHKEYIYSCGREVPAGWREAHAYLKLWTEQPQNCVQVLLEAAWRRFKPHLETFKNVFRNNVSGPQVPHPDTLVVGMLTEALSASFVITKRVYVYVLARTLSC